MLGLGRGITSGERMDEANGSTRRLSEPARAFPFYTNDRPSDLEAVPTLERVYTVVTQLKTRKSIAQFLERVSLRKERG